MNLIEHLLSCLGGEGAEIAQQTSKANRFGLDDVNFKVPNGPDNRERLVVELNQLIATADMCSEAGILPKDWRGNAHAMEIQMAKREAVETCMNYAETKGTLTL